MDDLPAGTLTFLFTDIEGSTRLLQDLGNQYADLLADHHRLLRTAFQERGGTEVETHGDGLYYAFPSAMAAVQAAVAGQRAVLAHPWPEGATVWVRMGLHTGEPTSGETGYVGIDIHRAARICTAAWGGQILLSGATRELIARDLPPGVSLRDLGQHRLKDLAQPERLFQVVAPDLLADFPPPKTLTAVPNNLPAQLTSFIGRERELAEVRRLVETTRLLTLTGTGGCGKTRLALQVAAELGQVLADGVWFVDLAPLMEPGLVPATIAAALRLREQPGRPLLPTIIEHLQFRHVLLVLDNCEHLVATCAQIATALLQGCPRVRIMATSRERLGVAGETVWRVPSLATPDLRHPPIPAALADVEAVRLFVDRAAAIQPGFALTERNAEAVARVCHQLDGIPLAIELAAARVAVLPPEQIARRLDDRFRLLTAGRRTALPRHQTLRAAMDWSYDLLSAQERSMLTRLSVFVGGFTLEAAEAVSAGEQADEFAVLDLLTQLVDKSLVIAEDDDGEVRYRLLETVRQYAHDRLRGAAEALGAQRRHAAFYLALAEQAEPHVIGPEQARWLSRLQREHANMRAALEWSLGPGDLGTGLRLVAALIKFWEVHGHFTEGRRWAEAVLTRLPERSGTRAKVLCGVGNLAWHQADYEAARASFEEGLTLARELGDKRRAAAALIGLGLVAWNQGEYARARSLYEDSLVLFRELEDRRGIAVALNNLGIVARALGDYAAARAFLQESLKIRRQSGDRLGASSTLHNLGLIAWNQGDLEASRALYQDSLAIARELGHRQGMAAALNGLGTVARTLGDAGAACAHYAESLLIFRDLGDKWGVADVLEGFGCVAAAQGDFMRAARIFGAAEVLREAIHAPLPPPDRADYERHIAIVRAGLGADA
ncbi:MAG: tetratricopeptide repeat protein, partial [Armatimonadetes bacterium]|nr:tetratricopeptide repeat protein [Armatimonadota bacterium]